jgi:quinol monooxygenase YgiN
MAAFVQIIQWKSSKIDEVRKLSDDYRAGRVADSGGPRRVLVLADKDNAGTYYTIAEFESAEAAAENSARSDTSEFAAKMAELCDGPPTFHNTEVIDEMAMS